MSQQFPRPTGEWSKWALRLNTYLSSVRSMLIHKTTDESASEDGLLLWDRTLLAPSISVSGAYKTLAYAQPTTVTVASLPAVASSTGLRQMVSDADATTFNSIVAGGGANIVPVYSDGTNWRIG